MKKNNTKASDIKNCHQRASQPLDYKHLTKVIISLIASAFILVALLTYSSDDPSFLNARQINNFFDTKNYCGCLGSYVAALLMESLGYSSFLLVIFTGMYFIHINDKIFISSLRISSFIFLIFSLATLIALLKLKDQSQINDFQLSNRNSGFIGYYIGTQLITYYDRVITIRIIMLLIFILTMFSFRLSPQTLFLWSINLIKIIYKLLIRLSNTISKFNSSHDELEKLTHNHNRINTESESSIKEQELQNEDDNIKNWNNHEGIESSLSHKKSHKKLQETINRTVQKQLIFNEKDKLFRLPHTQLLAKRHEQKFNKPERAEDFYKNTELLKQVLHDFGVKGEIKSVKTGPVITLYELSPAAGTKSSRIIGLANDIARSTHALSARIAVIPGKNAIGIELPHHNRKTVHLRELLEKEQYQNSYAEIPLILGKDIAGESVIADLAKMPHLLIAGTTGSGKSVSINTMILSVLYKYTPKQCRLVMIDPKMLELSLYDGIPHLLTPVVTDPKKAVGALQWVVKEMEARYRLMSTLGVRNINSYNKLMAEAKSHGKTISRPMQTGFDKQTGKPVFENLEMKDEILPYIVVIVDEMADLMLVAGKDVESHIQRLSQMARAAGIHIIMATQRPSVDVITGVIKANFPTRISFQVSSKIDSRTILNEIGAEQLLGMGDMLYMTTGGKIKRIHAPFVSDQEINNVVSFIKEQQEPNYISAINDSMILDNNDLITESSVDNSLYVEAVEIVLRDRKASTSYIQRCLKIGYNRAAVLIERMEKEGIIGPSNHVGKREILG